MNKNQVSKYKVSSREKFTMAKTVIFEQESKSKLDKKKAKITIWAVKEYLSHATLLNSTVKAKAEQQQIEGRRRRVKNKKWAEFEVVKLKAEEAAVGREQSTERQLELSTCCNTLSMGLLGQRNLPSLHYYDISMAYLQ